MNEICITVTGQVSPEELIKKWGENNTVLESKGFMNPKENIFGIFIHDPQNPNEIIDIYLKNVNS